MEKNQKETGITLSFLRSEAIHCTRKRLKKKACPRKPIDSQNCSVVMIGASLDQQLESGHAKVPRACGPHSPYRRRLGVARIFRLLVGYRERASFRASRMASRNASIGWAPIRGLPLTRKVGVPGSFRA